MSRNQDHILQLNAELKSKGLDAYVTTKTADIRWLTGFSNVFDEEQAHQVLMVSFQDDQFSVAAKPCLFTDKRYSEAFRRLNNKGHWRILDESRPRFAFIAEQMMTGLSCIDDNSKDPKKTMCIGIESDLRLDWYKALSKAIKKETEDSDIDLELVEVSNLLGGLRAIKNAGEVALLKAAQTITDAAFDHMIKYLRPGITEKQAAFELEFFIRRQGADSLSFPSIVAGGSNSAIPHAKPSDRVLVRGDIVLMDFGARLNDYCSDMTRTVVLGEANEQQRKMYAAALDAHQSVAKAIKPGMKAQEAQQIAERIIAKHGFEGKFIHSLGHGVGIEIHELPTLAPKAEKELEIGNIITIEPGIYIEGVGGVRIEDFGVIREDGFESFTLSTKELLELSN